MSKSSKNPRGKLSTAQTGLLLDYLATGVDQQVPLDEVFRALADDLTDSKLQAVAAQLAEQLADGADLETALDRTTVTLPNHIRRSLDMGMQSGNLAGVLAGLAQSELAHRRMQSGLRSVLTYPLLVVGFLTLVLLFLAVEVVPPFREIFADFQLDLPQLTVWTLSVADELPRVLGVGAAALGVIFFIGWLISGRRFFHWIRTAVPLLGRAWIWSGQHEFATSMATLTEQQIPVTEALDCTAHSLRDRNVAWAAQQASVKCADGALLSQSLRESLHFDPTTTALAQWGETTQSLPAAFREAAETYEQQMQLYLKFLQRIIPPLMLAFVASTLLLCVVSLLIPLVQLIQGLTG